MRSLASVLVVMIAGCQIVAEDPEGVLYPDSLRLGVAHGGYALRDCAERLDRALPEEGGLTPHVECALFSDPDGVKDEYGWYWPSEERIAVYFDPLEQQGWLLGHIAVREFYFVRPTADPSCQDVLAVFLLQRPEIEALLPPGEDVARWRGVAILDSTGQRCGEVRWGAEPWRETWALFDE